MYFRYYEGESNKGHVKKFDSQILALRDKNLNVCFYSICEEGHIYYNDNKQRIRIASLGFLDKRFLKYWKFNYEVGKHIRKTKILFDFAYIRLYIPFFGFIRIVKNIWQNSSKIVMEIPTYPFIEEQNNDPRKWRKPLYVIANILYRYISKYIDLYAVIGNQTESVWGKPAINICNGVDVDNLPIKTNNYNACVNLLIVAKISYYHGIDRLISAINNYYTNGGTKKVILNVVGSHGDGTIQKLKRMVRICNLEGKIVFHGYQNGSELDKIFNYCDLAFDFLGGHRKGLMCQTISLKMGEYIGRGIPFITQRTNNSLVAGIPYCFPIIDYSDNPLDMKMIIKIIDDLDGVSGIALAMRNYAKSYLTWGIQFDKIFQVLR